MTETDEMFALRKENAALKAENAVLRARNAELEPLATINAAIQHELHTLKQQELHRTAPKASGLPFQQTRINRPGAV